MTAIVLIGLTLFLSSAAAIYVTLRASSISDLKRRPLKNRGGQRRLRLRKRRQPEDPDSLPLADRRKLDDHARSLEGAVFFF